MNSYSETSLYLWELHTYGGSSSKNGLWCHSVNSLIYRVGWDFWKVMERGGWRFSFNPSNPGGGAIFARGKFKFKLILNSLCYEPETSWLFLTFTGDYFAGKKIQKNIKLSGGKNFFTGGIAKK